MVFLKHTRLILAQILGLKLGPSMLVWHHIVFRKKRLRFDPSISSTEHLVLVWVTEDTMPLSDEVAEAGPSSAATKQTSVLFVCLGNICRSPMAEAVFRSMTDTLPSSSREPKHSDQFRIDSAGTGAYHALSPPDPRTMQVLKKHGISGYDHAARKLCTQDFLDFDYIFAMDAENLEDINEVKDKLVRERKIRKILEEKSLAEVVMFGSYGGKTEDEEVDDPYYGGQNGFDITFEQVSRFSKGFIAALHTSDQTGP